MLFPVLFLYVIYCLQGEEVTRNDVDYKENVNNDSEST